MTKAIIEERAAAKYDQWRQRIAEQRRSGMSVKEFCKQRGLTDFSFYTWRKRLRKEEPIRFALVGQEAVGKATAAETTLELILVNGVRLRIGSGVDGTTLRMVLEALGA